MRYVHIIVVVLLCIGFMSCGSDLNEDRANKALDRMLRRSSMNRRNAVMSIESPEFSYAGAAGRGRADSPGPMTTEHQYYIASLAKSMTAAIILQMSEEGAFDDTGLDMPLAETGLFPEEVIHKLHLIDGHSFGNQITIRHLLNHTSGLKDVLMDDENGTADQYGIRHGGFAPESLLGVVVFDKEKGVRKLLRCLKKGQSEGCDPDEYYLRKIWDHWDFVAWQSDPNDRMAGLMNFYLSGMNRAAISEPGTNFHYADTNYTVLGLLIEHISGNSLHHELRNRIFDPLGMDHSYLTYSTYPQSSRWEQEISDFWALGTPTVSKGINFSMDWAAGGVYSTVADLSSYLRALVSGGLFRYPSTLDTMLDYPFEYNETFGYGGGVHVSGDGGSIVVQHSGLSGSWMIYHFESDLSFVGTANEIQSRRFFRLIRRTYKILNKMGYELSSPF